MNIVLFLEMTVNILIQWIGMCKFEMPAWNMLRRGFSTFSNGHTVLTASRVFLPTRDLPDVAHENTDSYKVWNTL